MTWEDVLQETLKRAWDRRATFDPTRSAIGWVFGILNCVLLEHSRADERRPVQPTAAMAEWEALEARMGDPDRLPELMTALTPKQRELVTMSYVDGIEHRDIARHFGISEVCSRVRLARAMNELRLAARKEEGR